MKLPRTHHPLRSRSSRGAASPLLVPTPEGRARRLSRIGTPSTQPGRSRRRARASGERGPPTESRSNPAAAHVARASVDRGLARLPRAHGTGFLASGAGQLAERRELARANPSQGALDAPQPAAKGSSSPVARFFQADFAAQRPPGGDEGGNRSSPGTGVLRGHPGDDHRASAAVALGRPLLPKGPPAVPADVVARPRDDVRSWTRSRRHGAVPRAREHGGRGLGRWPRRRIGSGRRPIEGVTGSGSRSVPLGGGAGPYLGLDDQDPRISAYRRSVLAKSTLFGKTLSPSLRGSRGVKEERLSRW